MTHNNNKRPTGKVSKFICGSLYAPPRSRHNNKLAVFLATTINQLRMEHPGSQVILGADINDMKLNTLLNLDPSLKQIVREASPTRMETRHWMSYWPTATIWCRSQPSCPPSRWTTARWWWTAITVRPFPESHRARFSCQLQKDDWISIHNDLSSTEMLDKFENISKDLVDTFFPEKTISVGPADLPYFTKDLRKLKRTRLRAYDQYGKRSRQYIKAKE